MPKVPFAFPGPGVFVSYYLSYNSRNLEFVEPCPNINESFSLGAESIELPSDPKQDLGSLKSSGNCSSSRSREGQWPALEDTVGLWWCHSGQSSLHELKMPQSQALLVTVMHMFPRMTSGHTISSLVCVLHPPSQGQELWAPCDVGPNVVQVLSPISFSHSTTMHI